MTHDSDSPSVKALRSVGEAHYASELADIEKREQAADARAKPLRSGVVERLIYGPTPAADELYVAPVPELEAYASTEVLETALDCLTRGDAFTADKKLSRQLRESVAGLRAYGYTIGIDQGGAGASYRQLAELEESLAANGLGALAVEISGELTIGAGGLIAYGSEEQKSLFLPMLAEGRLMGFALTEVGVGVNAKKVSAWTSFDEANGCWRLHATESSDKLYITSATYGGLLAVVARVGSPSGDIGIFIIELPDQDIERDEQHDYAFRCRPSGVDAFHANINSRLTFDNFPIPASQKLDADGLEVLFFSLALGRCMLSAMSAGMQTMYAADALNYARQRDGVGGKVIRHELPQLNIGRMLGGALQSRALCHLSLQQREQRSNLAGLRDITKAAAAGSLMDSLLAAERVLGGRSLDSDSRVSESRHTAHAFSIVEGENDLITLSMVREVTSGFTRQYLNSLLAVMASVNTGEDGEPLPPEKCLFRLSPLSFLRHPRRVGRAIWRLVGSRDFWQLMAWMVREAGKDLVRLPWRLLPAGWRPRYRGLPPLLRPYASFAERKLRGQRWVYILLNLYYQLELTRAQIPMHRFGKRLEHLVAMVAVVYGAAGQSVEEQRVAALQAELLKQKVRATPVQTDLLGMDRLRRRSAAVTRDLLADSYPPLKAVRPQAFSHPWDRQEESRSVRGPQEAQEENGSGAA